MNINRHIYIYIHINLCLYTHANTCLYMYIAFSGNARIFPKPLRGALQGVLSEGPGSGATQLRDDKEPGRQGRNLLAKGPEEPINTRILHSGSRAQDNADSRNHGYHGL